MANPAPQDVRNRRPGARATGSVAGALVVTAGLAGACGTSSDNAGSASARTGTVSSQLAVAILDEDGFEDYTVDNGFQTRPLFGTVPTNTTSLLVVDGPPDVAVTVNHYDSLADAKANRGEDFRGNTVRLCEARNSVIFFNGVRAPSQDFFDDNC